MDESNPLDGGDFNEEEDEKLEVEEFIDEKGKPWLSFKYDTPEQLAEFLRKLEIAVKKAGAVAFEDAIPDDWLDDFWDEIEGKKGAVKWD